jgi:DNA-binding NarL/FixJ family response regulator
MEQATEPIRILIADDHPIFRFGMRTLLTALPDFTVVGEAVTGAEAIQLTDLLMPDVVLMDIKQQRQQTSAKNNTGRTKTDHFKHRKDRGKRQ